MHASISAHGSSQLQRIAHSAGPVQWAIAVWAVMAAAMLAMDAANVQKFFPDTDDATRLIQVHEFLASGAWFDTTLPRFGPDGLPSHWSRLIDLPLAVFISLASIVVPVEMAELFAQIAWPLLLLLPLLIVLARTLEILDSRAAAGFALGLAATALTAFLQFKPGRIDHHNAMIVATMTSIFLMAVARPTAPGEKYARDRAPYLAGGLAALSLTIGFEALPVIAASTVALLLWALYDGSRARPVAIYCAAFAAALTALFVISVPPSRWMTVACDALSLNLVLLTAIGAAGAFFVLTRCAAWSLPVRLAALAAAGLAGGAIYGALEPACLAGPFGQVPKAIYPIWLDYVGEARPLWWHFARMPALAVSIAAMLAAGVAAYVYILKRRFDDRLAYLATVSIATSLFAIWQFKFLSYATWLAIPAIAILIARIEGTAQISRLSMQLLALICLSPATVNLFGAMLAKTVLTPAAAATSQQLEAAACSAKSATGALDALSPGLVVTHIDIGPVIVATTRHRALSGPYHRLPEGILAASSIFAAEPSAALAKLSALGARYVVDCPARSMPGVGSSSASDTLLSALRHGRVPSGLSEVTTPAAAPLRVWQMEQPSIPPST